MFIYINFEFQDYGFVLDDNELSCLQFQLDDIEKLMKKEFQVTCEDLNIGKIRAFVDHSLECGKTFYFHVYENGNYAQLLEFIGMISN